MDLLQRDLDCLSDWCSQWKLKLSCPKCFCMRVGHSPAVLPPCSYQLAGEHLSLVPQHRDLGIIVSCDLSWRNHYLHLCKTAYCSLHFVRRVSPVYNPFAIRKNLYLTLVRSKLCFCSQLWRPHLIKDISLLERVQRRATKFIVNFDRTLDYKERPRACGILPLMMQFELYDLLFLFKSIKFRLTLISRTLFPFLLVKPDVDLRESWFVNLIVLIPLGISIFHVWFVYGIRFLRLTCLYPLLLSGNLSLRNCGLISILILILVHFITPVLALLVISLSTPIYNYIAYYFHSFCSSCPSSWGQTLIPSLPFLVSAYLYMYVGSEAINNNNNNKNNRFFSI